MGNAIKNICIPLDNYILYVQLGVNMFKDDDEGFEEIDNIYADLELVNTLQGEAKWHDAIKQNIIIINTVNSPKIYLDLEDKDEFLHEVYCNLVLCFYQTGNLNNAFKYLEQAIDINSNLGETVETIGSYLYLINNNTDMARTSAQSALQKMFLNSPKF